MYFYFIQLPNVMQEKYRISPKVARRHRYEIEEKTASEEENNRKNVWLSR